VSLLTLTQEYDLPRSIVWDAFVDPVLVDGWLPPGSLAGAVTAFEPLERLVVQAPGGGILEFRLAELAGGTRGSSTSVTVVVTGHDPQANTPATWRGNLENLEHLLRGHPVDWIARQSDGSAAAHDAADGA
jgi:hypothetical protein